MDSRVIRRPGVISTSGGLCSALFVHYNKENDAFPKLFDVIIIFQRTGPFFLIPVIIMTIE